MVKMNGGYILLDLDFTKLNLEDNNYIEMDKEIFLNACYGGKPLLVRVKDENGWSCGYVHTSSDSEYRDLCDVIYLRGGLVDDIKENYYSKLDICYNVHNPLPQYAGKLQISFK